MSLLIVVLLVALAAWVLWQYVWLPARVTAQQQQTQAAVNKLVSSAQAARDLGHADAAVRLYDKAIARQPENLQLYIDAGSVKLSEKDYAGALAYFERTTQLNPDYYFGYLMASLCHCNLKNYQRALTINNEIINSGPHDSGAFVGYLGRGSVFIYLRKFDRALGDFEQAYTLKPDFALTSCSLAEAFCYIGEFEKALKYAEQALEQMASLSVAYLWRGWAKYGLARHEEALKDCNYVIQQDPKNPKGYEIRGLVHREMGRLEPALADLEKALALYREDEMEQFEAEVLVPLAEVRRALGKDLVDGE